MLVKMEVDITHKPVFWLHYLDSELSVRCVTKANNMIFYITFPWLRNFLQIEGKNKQQQQKLNSF